MSDFSSLQNLFISYNFFMQNREKNNFKQFPANKAVV